MVSSGSKVTGFVTRNGDKKWTHTIEAGRYPMGRGVGVCACGMRVDVHDISIGF